MYRDLWPIGLILFFCLGVLYWVSDNEAEENGRLMSQCLADGKKEYECKGLLKQEYVPVFIPVGK